VAEERRGAGRCSYTFGRSLDGQLQVIDLFGRQPTVDEDVRDAEYIGVSFRSTYLLEAEP
jgi:hypothetical protein